MSENQLQAIADLVKHSNEQSSQIAMMQGRHENLRAIVTVFRSRARENDTYAAAHRDESLKRAHYAAGLAWHDAALVLEEHLNLGPPNKEIKTNVPD